MTNTFVYGGSFVSIPNGVSQRFRGDLSLDQVIGFASDGTKYIYSQSPHKKSSFALTIGPAKEPKVDEIEDFTSLLEGQKNLFTWHDHNDVSHVVRLERNGFLKTRTSHNRFLVTLDLEEIR